MLRSITLPFFAAVSSAMPQKSASADASRPRGTFIVNTPEPVSPAAIIPDGEVTAATAIGMCGFVYGRSCRRAFFSVNQSLSYVIGSTSVNRRLMIFSASFIRGRCRLGSMPSITASVGSAPGPTPNSVRPRVMWSSSTMRSATINGWWYGSETTPVPSLMCFVRAAAAAMNTSGDAISSQPAL